MLIPIVNLPLSLALRNVESKMLIGYLGIPRPGCVKKLPIGTLKAFGMAPSSVPTPDGEEYSSAQCGFGSEHCGTSGQVPSLSLLLSSSPHSQVLILDQRTCIP